MKIYITHATSFDYRNELYSPLRKSKLNMLHEIILPHENSNQHFPSKELMSTYDLVIAEVSFPSTGQGIELGWADTCNTPIVCFYKSDKNPSSSLKALSNTFIEYTSSEDMIGKLEDYLSSCKN